MGRNSHIAVLAAIGVAGALAACGPQPPAAQTAQAPPQPREVQTGPAQSGKASYYGREFAGQTTASGGTFKPHKLTAASKTLPLGTKAKVVNKENGKAVRVTVTDRGPYAKNRIIDVSAKAAEKLDMKQDGVANVKVAPVAVVTPPPAK